MTLAQLKQSIEIEQQKLCSNKLARILPWFTMIVFTVVSLVNFKDKSLMFFGFNIEYLHVSVFVLVPFCIGLAIKCIAYLTAKKQLTEYREMSARLAWAEKQTSILSIRKTISDTQEKAARNGLVNTILDAYLPLLNNQLGKLRQARLRGQLDRELKDFKLSCDKELASVKDEIPLIKARANIKASIDFLKLRRDEITTQWEQAYEQFSWFNKLKYAGDTPDFTEMNKVVDELEHMNRVLVSKHSEDFERIDAHFEMLKGRAVHRVSKAKATLESFIQECGHQEGVDSDLLKKTVWLSALSLPFSMWADADRAGDVFDALRQVNSNYANMSDSEIWWETLFLPSESLVGLAALTKGAYFEQLVASGKGGELFEHFNNPNTDIVIDGIAFQLKATDSASYVNSVTEDIPVIATSEVALTTGAIDSGYSNEELANTVDLALGDTVVDVGDSVVAAILTGVGGLGFFATVEGLNHGVKKHENGGDGVEAMFEGAGVAIESSARGLVGAAEMSYKVLTSKPSRFVGRMLHKGFVKLDEKIMAEAGRK